MHDDPIRIPLHARDGSVRAYALVDRGDAGMADLPWHLNSNGYAVRNVVLPGGRGAELLHRAILGLVRGDGFEGDHKDGDRLNCQRSNLRIGSHAANAQNVVRLGGTSNQRGVSWNKATGNWMARVKIAGREVYLGCFDDEQTAAEVAKGARLAHLPFTNEERAA